MSRAETRAALMHKLAIEAAPKPKPEASTKREFVSEAHKRVIDAWFANGCVSQRRALLAAGYADTTATGNPHSVFQREDVRAEIARRRALRDGRKEITQDRIEQEIAKIAFASLGDLLEVNEDGSAYLDMVKLTEDQKAAMAEFNVETYTDRAEEPGISGETVKKSRIKFHSKLAALDSLARIKGMFQDKVEVTGMSSLVDRIAEARKRTAAASKDGIT